MAIEVGNVFEGRVTGVKPFGAFVALPEGRVGMVHISEVSNEFVQDIAAVLHDGDTVKVQEKVSLVQDTDKLQEEEGEGSVVLMTIHSAKGLEFPVVFMVGMENGIFPSMTDLEVEAQMEESRRLCYVAITRAKECLYMTSAEVRKVFGRTVSYSQSDFIDEVSSSLKEYVNERGMYKNSNKQYLNRSEITNNPHSLRGNLYNSSKNTNKTLENSEDENKKFVTKDNIVLGAKVKHSKFGIGTIVSVAPSGDDKKVTIAFDKQGIKMLLLSFAKLEFV